MQLRNSLNKSYCKPLQRPESATRCRASVPACSPAPKGKEHKSSVPACSPTPKGKKYRSSKFSFDDCSTSNLGDSVFCKHYWWVQVLMVVIVVGSATSTTRTKENQNDMVSAS
eukprot:3972322-Amphidinium_carterae.1